jgi:Family of unknown function (DUF6159)
MDASRQTAPSESRLARSWRLTRIAGRLVLANGTLIRLAVLSTVTGFAGCALLFWIGGVFDEPGPETTRMLVAFLALMYPLTFVATFINVATAAAAGAALRGGRISVRDALGVAAARTRQVAAWSLLSSAVGILLRELVSRLPGASNVLGWLAGVAWGLATLFVAPILALEGLGPIETAKRSVHLLRSRWGEGVAGSVAITAWAVVVALPAGALLGFGLGATDGSRGFGVPAATAGIALLVVTAGAANVVRETFAVALYRYALSGSATGPFPEADLAHPFTTRRRVTDRGQALEEPASRVRRVMAGAGALALAAIAVLWLALLVYVTAPGEYQEDAVRGVRLVAAYVLAVPGIALAGIAAVLAGRCAARPRARLVRAAKWTGGAAVLAFLVWAAITA